MNENWAQEFPFVIVIVGAVFVGLWVSNILYDLKVPQYLSRKIGHGMGGFGYLLCGFVFSSAWVPLVTSAGFVALMAFAKFFKPDTFRGVGGTGRAGHLMGEVWFPLSALIVIFVGWFFLNRPWEAIACILFMAWGDCVSGIIRSQLYTRPVKGLWGSLGMLTCCTVLAWAFVTPFWIGMIAALVATVTEWACGDISVLKCADDNLMIPLTSAAAIFGLLALTGGL